MKYFLKFYLYTNNIIKVKMRTNKYLHIKYLIIYFNIYIYNILIQK